jgi:hypothetical protein
MMPIAGLLASIESNMGGVPTPAAAVAVSLQGAHMLYDEGLLPGPTPVKTERGGLGTLALPGGGGYQGSFLGASLSGKKSELLFGANWAW